MAHTLLAAKSAHTGDNHSNPHILEIGELDCSKSFLTSQKSLSALSSPARSLQSLSLA